MQCQAMAMRGCEKRRAARQTRCLRGDGCRKVGAAKSSSCGLPLESKFESQTS